MSGGGQDSSEYGEGGRSWAWVVQQPSKQPSWTSYRILEKEINNLQRYLSKVLKFPEIVLKDSRWRWEKVAVFVRSLGRRSPGGLGGKGDENEDQA